ncbi:hypothetical protein NDU88_006859 [Pleurodeles waltl]|uniref:Uncharacterized protein n=1 Tax=Pleurodeles waltl TaxID=8319 RepID=A0AAV7N235_PLEWA|nr:hypothetical protein NDU88_006859 [Pleurodeles waltl]
MAECTSLPLFFARYLQAFNRVRDVWSKTALLRQFAAVLCRLSLRTLHRQQYCSLDGLVHTARNINLVIQVPVERCRYLVGTIIGEGDEKPKEDLVSQFEKFGFNIITFPEVSHAVTSTFPYTTPFSIQLATTRVHSALNEYIKERKLCAHPYIEIYKGDLIQFVCPLSRQSDFYVPEMKELLRKLREEEEEAGIVDTGTDMLSDSSSMSLEGPDNSRETSVATNMTSDFPTTRNREEVDNRSEHSYSESGASCSSFEELDLEASANEGAAGRPPPVSQIGFKVELDSSSKWDKQPLLMEKVRGEE